MTRAETAWVAGLIEGEGTFAIKPKARLSVVTTDLDVIERLPRLTGVGRIYVTKPAQEHYKVAYVWAVVRQRHVAAVVGAIRPWLGGRRGAAADLMLDWLASRSSTRIRT